MQTICQAIIIIVVVLIQLRLDLQDCDNHDHDHYNPHNCHHHDQKIVIFRLIPAANMGEYEPPRERPEDGGLYPLNAEVTNTLMMVMMSKDNHDNLMKIMTIW